MIFQVLQCPYCQGIDLVKNGKSPQGKQRFYVEKADVMVEHSFETMLIQGNHGKSKNRL
jgi:hypothetical protein